MRLFKRPILNAKLSIIEDIRDQINSLEEKDKLGIFGIPEKISLSEAAFRYSNAIVEKKILYVDIETISTPKGVEFRRLLETEADIEFFAEVLDDKLITIYSIDII
jgi:hypothetical protein